MTLEVSVLLISRKRMPCLHKSQACLSVLRTKERNTQTGSEAQQDWKKTMTAGYMFRQCQAFSLLFQVSRINTSRNICATWQADKRRHDAIHHQFISPIHSPQSWAKYTREVRIRLLPWTQLSSGHEAVARVRCRPATQRGYSLWHAFYQYVPAKLSRPYNDTAAHCGK